jgi:hypothetical protein
MSENSHDQLQRDVLPIPNDAYAGPIVYDTGDSAAIFPPIQYGFSLIPAGAPLDYIPSAP